MGKAADAKTRRSEAKPPSDREAVILQILTTGGIEGRYGLEIRERYEAETKRKMPLGSLYTTLNRMVDKGYLSSEYGESTHERGGNRRRYFRIEGPGARALEAYRSTINDRFSAFGVSLKYSHSREAAML